MRVELPPPKVDASARVVAAVCSMRYTARDTSPENLKPILEAFPIEHGIDPDRSPAVGTPAERPSRPRTGGGMSHGSEWKAWLCSCQKKADVRRGEGKNRTSPQSRRQVQMRSSESGRSLCVGVGAKDTELEFWVVALDINGIAHQSHLH